MSKKRIDLLYAAKQIIYFLIKYSGGFAICKRLSRRGLRILCYHGIWPEPNREHNLSDALFMTPEKFESRMDFLASLKYPIVSLDDAVKQLKDDTLPDCATVITIDDGWYNSYRYMLPVFDRHKMHATIYQTTYFMQHQEPITQVAIRHMVKSCSKSRIDLSKLGIGLHNEVVLTNPAQREIIASEIYEVTDRLSRAEQHRVCVKIGDLLHVDYESLVNERLLSLMNAEEVRNTSERGYDIQLHTHRHRISDGGISCLSNEIIANHKALNNLTDQRLNHFCYPSGVYSSSYWPELENLGIVSATTCNGGLNYVDTNVFELNRILDSEARTNLDIEAELCGLRDVLSNVRKSVVGAFVTTFEKIRQPMSSGIINLMSRSDQNAKLLVFCFDTAITHHTESEISGISPELFKRQINWLARHYSILPLSEAINLCRAGKLHKPTACITFDHDFKSHKTIAAPYLKEQNIPATFFVSNRESGHSLPPTVWISLFNLYADRKSRSKLQTKCAN